MWVITSVALVYGATWIYVRFMVANLSGGAIDPERVVFNLRLGQILIASAAVWLALRSRCALHAHAGHGLVLASFGLQARLLAEFARDGTEFVRDQTAPSAHARDVPAMFQEMAGTAYESQVALTTSVGLAAFAVGLLLLALDVGRSLHHRWK